MLGKILVCDDNEIVRSVIAGTLASQFYSVSQAASAEDALAAMKADRPAILVSDIVMDGMDGFELCATVKRDPALREIAVVLVTALSAQADRNRGVALGADDFITKPIHPTFLCARIRNIMRLRTLREDLAERHAGALGEPADAVIEPPSGAFVIVAGDARDRALCETLERELDLSVSLATSVPELVEHASGGVVYALLINPETFADFSIDLCMALREFRPTRLSASVAIAPLADPAFCAQLLDAGIHDLCAATCDVSEILFRMRAQLRAAEHRRRLSLSLDDEIAAATADPLTGLSNRRFLERLAPRFARGVDDDSPPTSVIAFDLDHFKAVNDSYGHAAGDAVLQEFAARLKASSRGDDHQLRLGGEEFALVLPKCSISEASEVAERVRAAVSARPFATGGGLIPVTVSVGVSAVQDGEGVFEALARADRALYDAKAGGRNRVIAA